MHHYEIYIYVLKIGFRVLSVQFIHAINMAAPQQTAFPAPYGFWLAYVPCPYCGKRLTCLLCNQGGYAGVSDSLKANKVIDNVFGNLFPNPRKKERCHPTAKK